MMCVSRYDNTGQSGFRDLFMGAADAYRDKAPPPDADVWPMTFGHAISLELAAWRHTANRVYLDQARKFGEMAIESFWGTSALPKASLKSDHYETITGADTLALSLVEFGSQHSRDHRGKVSAEYDRSVNVNWDRRPR